MIIHKIQRFPQATKPIMTNKNYNNQQGRSPTVAATATCNDKECQVQQQQRALHTSYCVTITRETSSNKNR